MIKRGEIYLAKLKGGDGSVQNGLRPVVIAQNDIGNLHSTTTIIVPVTSKMTKHNLPTHFSIKNLHKESIGLCEQIQTISKSQLIKAIGVLDEVEMKNFNNALLESLDLK